MLKKGEIAARIYDQVAAKVKSDMKVKDARIGLGYVAVRLNNDRTGLSAVLLHELASGCQVFQKPGTLEGSDPLELLKLLVDGRSPLERALGLATANALTDLPPRISTEDSIDLMALQARDRVAMIGFFPPLVKRIQEMAIPLNIIERNPQRAPLLSEEEKKRILQQCSVAIITATSILNSTIDEVLNDLEAPRHVAVLGPSTPMIREVFESTPVNHLGGAVVSDPAKVIQIVSEGGGTPAMRPYLNFVNLVWNRT